MAGIVHKLMILDLQEKIPDTPASLQNHVKPRRESVTESVAPVPYLGGNHVAFRQKVAAPTVGYLAGVKSDRLLLWMR